MMPTELERLARIEAILQNIQQGTARIEEQLAAQNGRVRSLEKWRDRILGGGSIIVFVLPFLWEFIRRVIFS